MLFDSILLIKEREGDVQLIEKTSCWERGLHQKLAFWQQGKREDHLISCQEREREREREREEIIKSLLSLQ